MKALREKFSQLGEEKFKWMQIARDEKVRRLSAEKKIGHLLREIDDLKLQLSQATHHRRRGEPAW